MWSPWHNIQATCHVDADSAGVLPEFRRNGTHLRRRRLRRDFARIPAKRHPLYPLAASMPTPPGFCQNSGGTVPTLYTFESTAERCGVPGITSRPLATSTPTPPRVFRNSGGTAPILPTCRVDADSALILPEFRRNGTYPVYLRVDG